MNLVNPVILVNMVILVNLLNLKKPVSLTNLVILVNIVNLVNLVILVILREAPTKKVPLLLGHCPFGGGSRPLPGWFGALI